MKRTLQPKDIIPSFLKSMLPSVLRTLALKFFQMEKVNPLSILTIF